MEQRRPIQLTPRQREVLKLAAAGATHKKIAKELGVTSKTARNHLANLYQQLDVHNRAEAVVYALRLGLVELEANASSTSPSPAKTIVVLKQPVGRRPQGGVNG